jgi:hypothetical protein
MDENAQVKEETMSPQPSQDAFARVFEQNASSTSSPVKKPRKALRIAGVAVAVIAVIGVIFALAGFFVYGKVRVLKAKADDVKISGQEVYDAMKTQNLVLADEKLQALHGKVDAFSSEYKTLGWMGALPIVNKYYADGTHGLNAGYAGMNAAQTMLKAIEPYADVLGFKGQGSFTGGSAEERIVKIIDTLDKVTPSLDSVITDLQKVDSELAFIDEKRYPESFKGMVIRANIAKAKEYTKGATDTIVEAKPIIQVLPDLAGGKSRKKYLVIFQNSGELRPTGGFMTGYAILNVEKGKVEPEASGDIYDLDKNLRTKQAIPPILKRFLTTETKWNLRDMNLSPDFKTSMDTFYQTYQKVPGQPVNFDGIIAVDTHFLENLVKVLGPVDVAGFGTFTADNDKRCDCPQIIYALSEIVDRPTNYIRENRKGILGPMMKAILTKAYTAPKQVWPDLFTAGWKNIEGRHVQLYFFDEKSQVAAEAINAAGRVQKTPDGSDYLMIVDTNLAGAKSNFFVDTTIEHEIDLPANGELKHKIVVTYKNPFKASNCNLEAGQLCLNGKLNDWVRFYLPPGAKLVDSRGFDDGSVKSSQELNHQVVEGIFQLQPLSQAKIEITYTIPYADGKNYAVLVQKQGGTQDNKHIFVVNGEPHEFILEKDAKLVFPF